MLNISSSNLTNNRSILRNTLWNLAGYIAPLLAAIISIPFLIKELGVDRFGILTLAWMVVGYFSLFDLGLGRALTKLLSEKLGANEIADIPELVWTALLLMSLLGMAGTGVTLLLTNWLVISVLNIPTHLQPETLVSFQLLAWSIPIVIITTGLRGVLEAYQRFDLINIIRVPLGILTFLSPIAVLPFSNHLDKIVLILIFLRIIICIIHIFLCKKIMLGLFFKIKYSNAHLKIMFKFGSWMSVSNIIGPMMIYIDRFIIGSILSMSAVTYYVTPYELITKLLVIPTALIGVLFPVFSASLAHNQPYVINIFRSATHWIFLALFPVLLLTIVFAEDGLRLWLSEDFSLNSTTILQLLAAGVLFNSLANIPFAFIQGIGRPDLTAKLHLIELPFYLLTLWILINDWGIAGAAAAWSLRSLIDMIILFSISAWLDKNLQQTLKLDVFVMSIAIIILALAGSIEGSENKIIFSITIIIIFYIIAWHYFILGNIRSKIINHIKKLKTT